MALTINPNMMAMGAARGMGHNQDSRNDSSLSTGNDPGLRQIIRAEIKPLDNADAQTSGAAQETGTASGAQGASTVASETQPSPVVPEQQTGSLINTTDRGGSVEERLSGLLEGKLAQVDTGSQGRINSLMDMGPNQSVRNRLLDMEQSGNASLDDVSGPTDMLKARQENLMRGNQQLLESAAHNAEMVSKLFK